MNTPYLKYALILMAGISAAGCKTIIEVPSAIRCDASAELLARKCAKPGQIPEDATYGTLVDTTLADRKALSECGLTAGELRESLEKCNQAIDGFNKKIDEINGKK